MKRILKLLTLLTLMMVVVVSCRKPEEPNIEDDNVVQNDSVVDHSGTLNGRDYVDLGLPNGTLWATCNVGADSPEVFGDFLAWGETAPKDIYDWKSYKYSDVVPEHDCFKLSKYCTDSLSGLNGFVDNLTVLESVDDAAAVCWGDGWRMPTIDEWGELLENTTFTWVEENGVKGRLVEGCNGNTIFLPAAGFHENCDTVCTEVGVYWSSTLHDYIPERAWSYHFTFENCHLCGTYERTRGQCVRAVLSPK